MIVYEKMTAIADGIRSLLGITNTMGLDEMAENLKTESANIESAYAAVNSKGGTVPDSKISGNLADAISSIALGISIQRKSGSFTTRSGRATVDCGFQPDLFYFTTGGKMDGYLMTGCLAFLESGSSQINTTTWDSSDNIIDAFATRNSTGVSISMKTYDDAMAESDYDGKFSFVAVKYS